MLASNKPINGHRVVPIGSCLLTLPTPPVVCTYPLPSQPASQLTFVPNPGEITNSPEAFTNSDMFVSQGIKFEASRRELKITKHKLNDESASFQVLLHFRP